MQNYEYTVIPAPSRGEKAKGARTGAERFSYALLTEMNRMAANGWEYVRAETLPCEERSGLTSRTTVYHNVLVFRRGLHGDQQRSNLAARHDSAQPVAAAPASVPRQAQEVRTQEASSAPPPSATPVPIQRADAAAPVRQPDPPPSWPDGPSGDATPTGQPVPDRTHVPERVTDLASNRAAYPPALDEDEQNDGAAAGASPHRPAFGEAMPRHGEPDLPADPTAPPTRLGPAQR